MIPAPVPELEILDQAERFVEALILGEVADAIFRSECERLGLPSDIVVDSPLLLIAMAGASGARQ